MRVPKTIDGWFARTSMRRAPFWGTRTDSDGVFVFGTGRSAPEDPSGALLHEVAHFLEVDEVRCFRYGFGLKLPTVIIGGQAYEECLTFSPCAREIRVTAIQRALHLHFKAPFDATYWAKLIEDFVPGVIFAFAHYKDDSLRCGSPINEDIPYGELCARRIDRMSQDVLEQSAKICIEDLWKLWRHRSALHDARIIAGRLAKSA